MIKDAEKYAEQDKKIKEVIEAKNNLENYLQTMRNTLKDKDQLAGKISTIDKEKVKEALKTHQDWLDRTPNASKEELEEHLKDVTAVCDPIVSKFYSNTEGREHQQTNPDHEDL